MRQRARFFMLTMWIIAMAGCGSDRGTPTSPTRPVVPSSPFVGTWAGTIADSVAGAGTLRVTISEHFAISLLGSWASAFADPSFDDAGRVSATVDGSIVRFLLTGRPCGPSGSAARMIAATLAVEGARMGGDYVTLGCGAPREGRIDLAKQ